MFDIKAIRDNHEAFEKAMKRRKLEPQSPALLKLDEERRALLTELQNLQAARNEKSKQVGEVKRTGGNADALMQEVATLKDRMTQLEEKERAVADLLNQNLSSLPNILADDVPDGADEHGNVEVRKHEDVARPPVPGKNGAREHFEIGEALGMMDFEAAAKMSGARFVVLSGPLARLERALAQFMLDTHTQEHGYTEVSPPLMVRDEAMFGTGQLPKFAEDQFRTTRGDWLIPTSEVPLTNIVMDSIVEEETLPRRYTAFTPCFRQEAGSAGKDTRGMIRMHQFYKVEMVSIVHPDKSDEEHQRMTACAETVLKKLGLSFRTMMLCSGDTGFGSRKTFDIEVWLPGQGKYREISSCSNCWDFQARRMNARFKGKGDKNTRFLHTLNGSGVATGRALIAVMENYYDSTDGGIFVPDALKPYMGGIQKILKA